MGRLQTPVALRGGQILSRVQLQNSTVGTPIGIDTGRNPRGFAPHNTSVHCGAVHILVQEALPCFSNSSHGPTRLIVS
jgi:hypothetical protein